jgi:hypothetical protein
MHCLPSISDNKIKKSITFIIGLLLLSFSLSSAFALDKGNFATDPIKNNGKKWRIGYYQGGDYIDYANSLFAMTAALMELGWIEPADLPPKQEAQTVFFGTGWQIIQKANISNSLKMPTTVQTGTIITEKRLPKRLSTG